MPKQFQVVVSAEARSNLEAACAWIEEADASAAVRWYEGMLEALGSLATLPTRCPVAPESRMGFVDGEMRQLLYGRHYWKYRILFTIAGDQVLIAHIRHGARLYLGEPSPEEAE